MSRSQNVTSVEVRDAMSRSQNATSVKPFLFTTYTLAKSLSRMRVFLALPQVVHKKELRFFPGKKTRFPSDISQSKAQRSMVDIFSLSASLVKKGVADSALRNNSFL
jgi:hypothetical protein